MYGIMLIVVLVITGGAIAFIGDRVGTKVGKKKLSLFGMRPRHTSILVTIITGICITTLTFVVMAAVSENVRTALFGMEELNRNMAETQQRLEIAGKRLGEAEIARAKTDEALKSTRGEVDKLHKEQKGLEAKAKELADGNAELEAAKQALTEQNKELVNGNEVLGKVNAKLVNDNKNLEQHAELLRENIIAMREGDIVFRAGEIIASSIVKGDRSLKEVEADMGRIIALANQTVAERLGAEDGKEGVWIYRPEFDQASAYIAEGKFDVVVRLVAAGNLVRGEPVRTQFQLFRNSVIYQENELIFAQPFNWTGTTTAEAQQVIMVFLREVNQAAQARGILADPISGAVGVMDGTQFYDVSAELLRHPSGRIVVSAYAKEDTDAMGPLRLILKIERE